MELSEAELKAYLINLSVETERLAFQEHQLRALNINFERIEAVTPQSISPNINAEYWEGWERPLRPSERACFLSHHTIWRRIALSKQPALVLEDDAILSAMVPAFLDEVSAASDIDHVTLETRGRRKLLSNYRHQRFPIRRLYQDRTGAAAYILWPSGAQRLLAHTDRAAMLADATICSAKRLSSWQADPPLAVQRDRCSLYRIAAPLVTISSIDPTTKDGDRRRFIYRVRRMLSQIRMGMNRLSHIFSARQEYLSPHAEDFAYLTNKTV